MLVLREVFLKIAHKYAHLLSNRLSKVFFIFKRLPEDIVIRTSPCIEEEYLRRDLLLVEQPEEFVKQSIWKWIDDHK